MANEQTVKSIANNWIIKGDREEDIFNKFISYWISFNCFYIYKTNANSDRAGINILINDPALKASFLKIIDINTTPVFNKLIYVCPIKNLKNGDELTISEIINFEQIINVLYLIRCNLFHGGKEETQMRDVDVMTVATPVLELIVKKLIGSHL